MEEKLAPRIIPWVRLSTVPALPLLSDRLEREAHVVCWAFVLKALALGSSAGILTQTLSPHISLWERQWFRKTRGREGFFLPSFFYSLILTNTQLLTSNAQNTILSVLLCNFTFNLQNGWKYSTGLKSKLLLLFFSLISLTADSFNEYNTQKWNSKISLWFVLRAN